MTRIRHSFIANIYYAFQDLNFLYLAVELVPGGDLDYHLRKRKFKEEQAKFIIASIILGLEYLHNNNIIHRNLTPSNILIDKKGYAKISDFLLTREWSKHNASETSGTPGYMAPEVM
jgi:serine/threonine protein kinase